MKIVFNSSLPRSGSTLLQNILAQNPRFHCTATSPIFDLLQASREQFGRSPAVKAQDPEIMKKAFLASCAGSLEHFLASLTDRPVCVDKSRGWLQEYEWLSQFHPHPKVLVPIRDLRSILSSMEKKWRQNPFQRPDSTADPLGFRMAKLEGRVAHWLNSIPVGSMIMHLLGAVERGDHRNFHIVRFEDITSQPQQTLDAIYDYLEEPRFNHDFSHVEQRTKENDAFFPWFGDHVIRSEVKPVPLDYHETLGKAISNAIKAENALYYTTFYPGR